MVPEPDPPSDAQLLSDLSVAIYEPPLAAMRETEAIADPRDPIAVLMLVIDLDTEVAMNGIHDFLGNGTGRHASETVRALVEIGADADASVLARVVDVAARAGMTHASVQADRIAEAKPLHAVTTFAETHGRKWDEVLAELRVLERELDFDRVYERAIAYVGAHRARISDALRDAKEARARTPRCKRSRCFPRRSRRSVRARRSSARWCSPTNAAS